MVPVRATVQKRSKRLGPLVRNRSKRLEPLVRNGTSLDIVAVLVSFKALPVQQAVSGGEGRKGYARSLVQVGRSCALAGLSVGGELVGSIIYTVESSPTDRQVDALDACMQTFTRPNLPTLALWRHANNFFG